ncbi:NAD(P)H:quinone oxidoreductase [Acidithiobacillus ferrooxidans F221]|uniref:NAD(P)H:quinone oxidoreductase n=1 Tax=Acidithiobacillus ferrooxidans TaxID=920 RepID=UPI001C070E37|nr:NAD(P)H:quinone oxidoreductase [Acidithiobacillus ferrooxidans F221]
MSRILVLYHSLWGHVEQMAEAEAEGARSVSGIQVDVRRVPETMPVETLAAVHAKTHQAAPEAHPDDLANYDGIIFGTPTRFGNMTGQMRNFLDRTGNLWQEGRLVGKVGSVFVSTATQHGGQETTLTSFHTFLFHQGMLVVGVPYSCTELMNMDEISGGTPYGASTMSKGDGSRQPSANELTIARFQGRHVAEITQKLFS